MADDTPPDDARGTDRPRTRPARPLAGEVAVVTGGTRGIGRAIAARLAADGATTVATYYRDEDAAAATEDALAAYDATTEVVQFDVRDPDDVSAAFEAIRERHGPPTVLVNNAGIMRNELVLRMDPADWRAVLETNLSGAFYCTQAVLRGLLRADGGAIVNVSSMAAERGWTGQASYAASKAGLLGLTRSLAREVGGRGIRVNAVCPGYVRTDMLDQLEDNDDVPDLEVVPEDRLAEPAEVADVVAFLASDGASYVNGAVLRIDGGRLA